MSRVVRIDRPTFPGPNAPASELADYAHELVIRARMAFDECEYAESLRALQNAKIIYQGLGTWHVCAEKIDALLELVEAKVKRLPRVRH